MPTATDIAFGSHGTLGDRTLCLDLARSADLDGNSVLIVPAARRAEPAVLWLRMCPRLLTRPGLTYPGAGRHGRSGL